MKTYKEDPPERYRIDYWLSFIAGMIYSALGGKGEMPLPPWMKREEASDFSIEKLSGMFSTVGIGVVTDAGKHDIFGG